MLFKANYQLIISTIVLGGSFILQASLLKNKNIKTTSLRHASSTSFCLLFLLSLTVTLLESAVSPVPRLLNFLHQKTMQKKKRSRGTEGRSLHGVARFRFAKYGYYFVKRYLLILLSLMPQINATVIFKSV